MGLDRRKFLKIGAGLSVLPLVPSLAMGKNVEASSINSGLVKNGSVITAAHWGILKLTIKDGVVVKSEPWEKVTQIDNPLQHYIPDMIYKSRVKYPYVRKSYLENPDNPKPELRGKEEFVRVSYDEAIKLIAKELKKTRDQKGTQAIFGGSYGWKSSGNMQNCRILLHRFLNVTGGFVGTTGDYSTGASQVIMPYVVGSIEVYEQQTSWENILENSKNVVIWGANPIATLRIAWTATDQRGLQYFEKLKNSKIKVICIDPIKTETAKFLNAQWIAPKPNTDVAMMIGMASHLIAKNKVNYEFLENYTSGFDKFKAYLDGKEDGVKKDVKWASKICGIDEKTIKTLAESFYDNPTMIMSGWGMQRAHHGEQPHWMLITLASMIGQIGTKGGGFGLSYHYSNGGTPTCKGGVIGGMTAGAVGIWKNGKFKGMPKAGEEQGGAEWLQNAASYSFPVARIADALLNPGKTIDNNGSKITYPDIDFIYWVGGNPLVHHQNTNNNVKAWQKPRTIVVNEIYWTPTAKMADIIMPATSSYERDDITMTGDYSNMNIAPMKQAVLPVGESKDDYEIFSDICKIYGKDVFNAYTENGKKAKDFIKEYYNSALKQTQAYGDVFETPMPSFEEFWAKNEPITFAPTLESMEWVRFSEFIEDPILNALGTQSGLIEIYSETIAGYNYDDCKAHPTWMEPIEWLGNATKEAPFHLLTNHPTDRLHSQMCHTSLREKYAVQGREPILINPINAKKLGIKDGDVVRVFNKRGEVLAGAVVTKDIMPNVVRLCEGGWYDPDAKGMCKYGSANVLTIDIPTSKLANGNISHTGLVNIEKYKGQLPEVSAFSDPKFAN
ncbi:molybdopterin guanine dinucleotide-containing S/N-oxide reductase [Campylobacter lari]|nr:molybdopterin guanine dinucleotide-containing S/N-oxide reductase [Campylobacter lari]MCV3342006.1 molybdopterin guanine dinucleotide-containing S/N-oxide reductase [Campylobacter lari]MCV3390806.1 molybdopterin guanine dinucleotide-containing S/N-oxide reductase [Campylobacter lari]MCV3401896.1 molybdopterin guanine dinucleotide-containing S/N-oxide reductase [Campylobacter lari]MCV3412665.1 molybdopterin guanine dinucleotide-containing S/N-oxide reductase [Campylobacter lari]